MCALHAGHPENPVEGLEGSIHGGGFFLRRLFGDELMGPAVQGELLAGVADPAALLRIGFDCKTRNEECRGHLPRLQRSQDARKCIGAELSPGDRARSGHLSDDPQGDCIEVQRDDGT